MRKYVQKLFATFKRYRAKPKKWRKQPTWLVCLFGGGASLISAYWAFALANFGPGLFMATNAIPLEQWSGAQVLAMLALAGCGFLVWYYLELAAKPLKELSRRWFKD